jgi:hypothetical protein
MNYQASGTTPQSRLGNRRRYTLSPVQLVTYGIIAYACDVSSYHTHILTRLLNSILTLSLTPTTDSPTRYPSLTLQYTTSTTRTATNRCDTKRRTFLAASGASTRHNLVLHHPTPEPHRN